MYSFLDPTRAHEFATDKAQLLHLAETFESSLANDLQALQDALGHQDPKPVLRLLHSLKGYVTFLSKDELSAQVIQLELVSRQQELEQVREMVLKVMPSLQQLRSEVTRWKSAELS
ncbi:MAG: Hpt domain-containing protein [Betaproteobacteria bacterium]|nr:Hpt domain-containing protein [Betaproteobacteria bacterium]